MYPDVMPLLRSFQRQLWFTVCFTRSVESKSLIWPSWMGKNWSSAYLRLIFSKCQKVRHRLDQLKSYLRFCLFWVSTKPSSKFSWIRNGIVQILKYFELPRVFKRVSIHQVEFLKKLEPWPKIIQRLGHDKISLSRRLHWGQKRADLGIRLFRGNVDITG